MEIIFKYSYLWILPIFVLSAFFAFLLYFSKKKADIPISYRLFLSGLRFITFFVLGLLLLSLLLKNFVSEIKKPVFLLVFDNSQSMISGVDSIQKRKALLDFVDEMKSKFENQYDFGIYSFGSKTQANPTFNFTETSSNIASAIKTIHKLNRHKNIGGLILVSDGIVNLGDNPIYASGDLPYPIYSFGVGDTSRKIDGSISRLLSNKIAFLDDKIPIVVDVKGIKTNNVTSTLELFLDGVKLEEKKWIWSSDYQISTSNFTVLANKPGIRKISVRLKEIKGEKNKINNLAHFYIEVIDVRQKILILYQAPHPDIAALSRTIRLSDNYLVEQKLFSSSIDINQYNLLIIHGLPSNNRDLISLKNKLLQSKVPYFLILNSDVNYNVFNSLGSGIQIAAKIQSVNEVTPFLNQRFEGFSIPPDFQRMVSSLPPINVPYGKFTASENLNSVLFQKIGNVSTDYPLLAINTNPETTNAILMGDGIWRWWLMSYRENGNTKAIDDFFMNIIRLTSLKVKRERFQIQHLNIYSGDEPVQMRALVYNSAFQLITSAEVNISITNSENGNEFSYSFSKGTEAYNLNLGILPAGNYKYSASVTVGNETFNKKGVFVVQHLNRELMNLEADFGLLQQMSYVSKGEFWNSLNSDSLFLALQKRHDLVSIDNKYLKYSDIIDIKILLGILILLVAVEWFVRKYMGIY